MKKRIISGIALMIYFFCGFGIVFASLDDGGTSEWNGFGQYETNKGGDAIDAGIKADGKNAGAKTAGADGTSGWGPIETEDTDVQSSSPQTGQSGKSNMLSTDFTFDPSNLSPSKKRYIGGTKQNISDFLATIGRWLLIATTTIAVLSITVGGLMIATTGPTDRAAKGKTIITLNIMGVVIALFSYSIIRFVSWIIAA